MKSVRLKIAASLFALIALAGCTQQSAPGAAAASNPVAPQAPAKQTTLVGFALGSYIEPATFAVGGQSQTFKTTDSLFAVVDFKDAVVGTTVAVSLRDKGGSEITRKERLIEDPSQTNLNFDLGVPKEHPLAAGVYSAEAFINGNSGSVTEITVD